MRSNFQTEKNWWFFFSKPTLNNSILQVSNALLITRHWTNVVIKVSCIYFLIVKEQSVSRMKNVLLHAHMTLKKAHHSSREDFFFLTEIHNLISSSTALFMVTLTSWGRVKSWGSETTPSAILSFKTYYIQN